MGFRSVGRSNGWMDLMGILLNIKQRVFFLKKHSINQRNDNCFFLLESKKISVENIKNKEINKNKEETKDIVEKK